MSRVEVRYVGLVRNAVERSREELELPEGITLRVLLQHLSELHGEDFRASVLRRDGVPRRNVRILVNGKSLDFPEGLKAELTGGSKVSIMVAVMAIAGG